MRTRFGFFATGSGSIFWLPERMPGRRPGVFSKLQDGSHCWPGHCREAEKDDRPIAGSEKYGRYYTAHDASSLTERSR